MKFLEGITELDKKKCHVTCKEDYVIRWRRSKGLNDR